MKVFSYSERELSQFANQVKEVLVGALHQEGLLKGMAPQDVCSEYAIVLYSRGLMGRIWDRIRGHDDPEATWFAVVKNVNFGYPGFADDGGKKEKGKVIPFKVIEGDKDA